jgi:hypothetical protein
MSDELLCDPCQRLLRGENALLEQDSEVLSFVHHATAESFQQALALPCGICIRLRADINRRLRTTYCLIFVAYNSLTCL